MIAILMVRQRAEQFQAINPIRFICGQVPKQGVAKNVFGGSKIIDSNTSAVSPVGSLNSGDPNWLLKNIIQRAQPAALAGKVPNVNGIGLERNISRFSGAANYEFANDIVATVQGGFNKQAATWARDFAFTALDSGYSRDPQYIKDHSFEARVASGQNQKFKWLVGANYYVQDARSYSAIRWATPTMLKPSAGFLASPTTSPMNSA